MYIILIIAIALLFLPLWLRGGALHNYLVAQAGEVFRQTGFQVAVEQAFTIEDGTLDFIDLVARRGNCVICVEIETSARYVLVNATKANALGLPLWIIVPDRKVYAAVTKKLATASYRPAGQEIYILLLSELYQVVKKCFPLFSPVNETTGKQENKKTGDKT
jgi:hypothetical protein